MIEGKIQLIISSIWKYSNDLFTDSISNILTWFNKKINIHFGVLVKNDFVPKRWEIYYIELGVNIWTEINKNRPCLVISPKKYNKSWQVIVVPIKTFRENINKNFQYIIKSSDCNWLTNDSIIDISHIKSVSKKRFSKKIWTIEEDFLCQINDWMSDILWIKKTTT